MNDLYDNWGDVASGIGLLATVIGLGIAIWQINRARKAARAAQDAASAAQSASAETRDAIHNVLVVSDLERVIGYVQQIKSFHRDHKWDTCLNMYQLLRSSLADIRARLPEPAAQHRLTLREAIDQVRTIEDNVDTAVRADSSPTAAGNFNPVLNKIQSELEGIVSSAQVQESEVST